MSNNQQQPSGLPLWNALFKGGASLTMHAVSDDAIWNFCATKLGQTPVSIQIVEVGLEVA